MKNNLNNYVTFLCQIKERIRSAQYEALKAVNKELINLYWDIGKMIVERQEKEGWGKAVVARLSDDLHKEFLEIIGFSVQNLWYMRKFYFEYSKLANLQPMVGEISWAKHIIILMRCKDALEREFYIRMTRKYGWTKNTLALKIASKSYENTLISQTNFNQTVPEAIKNQAMLAIKDEYQVVSNVPQNLKGALPTPEQIAILLRDA